MRGIEITDDNGCVCGRIIKWQGNGAFLPSFENIYVMDKTLLLFVLEQIETVDLETLEDSAELLGR